VYENRVFGIFWCKKKKEVAGGWRRLHNEGFHNLYASPNMVRVIISRRMRRVGHVARMGDTRNAYNILFAKPEGKRPLGRPRHRWEDNIGMDLMEIVGGRRRCGLDASGSGLGAVVGSCEHGNESSGSIKGGEFLE
jgi:hypothetical protein